MTFYKEAIIEQCNQPIEKRRISESQWTTINERNRSIIVNLCYRFEGAVKIEQQRGLPQEYHLARRMKEGERLSRHRAKAFVYHARDDKYLRLKNARVDPFWSRANEGRRLVYIGGNGRGRERERELSSTANNHRELS